jgi:hypothetical protein
MATVINQPGVRNDGGNSNRHAACPCAWRRNGIAEQGWLVDHAAMGGRLMARSSLSGAIVSRLMYRARWTAHSSFCSSKSTPIRLETAASLGARPVRRRRVCRFRVA